MSTMQTELPQALIQQQSQSSIIEGDLPPREEISDDLVPVDAQQSTTSSRRQNQTQPEQEQQPYRRKRHGARNQHRHKNFVKWIMETFQEECCQQDNNAPILDVAGGKGEVAARLTMCHQRSVIMVDPRPADVVHCFESLVLPKIPNKWQQRLESKRQNDPEFVSKTIQSRFQQLVTTFDATPSAEVQEAIEASCLLLGLHADSATEAIVDAALKYQKPFVVVPCCVFPNFFVHRKLQQDDGTWISVRTHEQFCNYLAQKDERFRVTNLPFEGRNVAIWWNGR